MPASEPDVVKIVKTKAKLGADERIGWWVHLSSNAVGLEAKDSCCHIINIISPTSNHRISIDFLARNSRSCQRSLERVPSLFVCYLFLQTNSATLANESVFSSTTGLMIWYFESPHVVTASDLRQK